ncbi:maleylpyruvate isomerase N-terminal domain-containing protein [Branchiibius sp. NY16-3462-2]|uniref:maleylpyruvate isomerase N-terminal domain-containing protein n=1 Tax=Branchiibius sp. NY16-3462-2 TaxID=1807500 RepID=UPI00079B50B7|nr:maleylpyruvate isomerase N-terminal domain-containing protein [Branchiibius sp. NY16-3462-2]KYH44028.1 hypothetical protein AZH51_04600 [Branchiibius sp. NY16-3462-2]
MTDDPAFVTAFDRGVVTTTAALALDLTSRPEVRAAWGEPSAAQGMRVGAMAQHLLAQVGYLVDLAGQDVPSDAEVISLLEHYRRAAWANSGLNEEVNSTIRDRANDAAADGPDAVLDQARARLSVLPDAMDRFGDLVYLNWQGWALTTNAFLITRLMEIVVHSDDLAASVDLPLPEFPAGAFEGVTGLLTAVATQRHGQAAIIHALSRPQRSTGPVSAF